MKITNGAPSTTTHLASLVRVLGLRRVHRERRQLSPGVASLALPSG